MLIHYSYIKQRSQFGKQCVFDSTDSVHENILPDPQLTRNYTHERHCHRSVQMSQRLALHEMQTDKKTAKECGMLHLEGGWPKEINVKDEEAVMRFRRRVEKDEYWAPRMKKLADPTEYYIQQNNRVNIYEHYFDDMIPTELVLPFNIRISNMYTDPQSIVRPVSHLSWSPGTQNRLAASYCYTEFETKPPNVNPFSYIWDIENPVAPVTCLRSSSPVIITEFNALDPSILISGLMSGQVCNWDIRIGDRPVQMSHRQFSHRNPANQALWTYSKTNMEFFSASSDGTIKWWDIRTLRQPIDMLVMDLVDPRRADITSAIGVTALQIEPTTSNKFLVGMENGVVINVHRRMVNPVDKLSARFNCHVGPVVAIDRNPFLSKIFFTVGDWTVQIWTDDTRDYSLLDIREQYADLKGACWSKSRYSVFFTINRKGSLEVYDILSNMNLTKTAFHVCNECLTAIAPHENGQILAIGTREGNIYLVECSEGYTVNIKSDKATFTNYFERSRRFEKCVEMRLKEAHEIQASAVDIVAESMISVIKKKGNNHERSKLYVKEKNDHLKKRSRLKKLTAKDDVFFEGLTEAETAFFQAVKTQFASYPSLMDDYESAKIVSLLLEIPRKKKKPISHEPPKTEEEEKGLEPVVRKTKSRKFVFPRKYLTEEEVAVEVRGEEVEETRAPLEKPRKRRRAEGILEKVCVEVCKPEICCADEEEKRKIKLRARDISKEDVSAFWKRRILEENKLLTDTFADEVEAAKREVRAWRQRVMSGKRDFWLPRATEVVYEKSERKKKEARNGADKSPVRNAEEGRSDFRQLAETSSRWKFSDSSDDKDKTLQTREKKVATEPRLEKYIREAETYPSDEAMSETSTMTTTTLTQRE